MTKRKKKNAITLFSLLLALAVLIGIYVWYSGRTPASEDGSDEAERIALAKVDTSQVTSLHYIGNSADISFTLTDGIWKVDGEPDRPIDQDKVTGILNSMSEINADKTVVSSPEDLSEYGLDQPSSVISASLKDGSTISLSLGDELISGDGYYAMVNHDKTVYVVASSYRISYTDQEFTEVEAAPSIVAENITYLWIDQRDGRDIELQSKDPSKTDNSGSTMYSWSLLKPYNEGYGADNSKVTEILPNYTGIDYLSCVDYKGADLSKYGLENPAATITIGYTEETATTTSEATDETTPEVTPTKVDVVYKLYIGDQNDDNEYYVRSDNSKMIYTLSGDSVEAMINVDAFDLINHYVNIPSIDTVDKITARVDNKEYTMSITRTSTTNDDGEEDTVEQFSYNGKEAEETTFRNVYKKLIAPMYIGELEEAVDTSTKKPEITLSFHLNGENATTLTTTFYPYNDSFELVDKGTGFYFLVDKRAVDDMIKSITTFTVE